MNHLRTYRNLALKHGLTDWSVRFLRKGTYRTCGLCNYRKKELSINREFCQKASEAEILDVMLHEIAHALTFTQDYPIYGRKALGHGIHWKARCRQVGANPSRLYEGDTEVQGNMARVQTYKYAIAHCETGQIYTRYMKKPRQSTIATLSRRYMKGRKKETLGKLELIRI